MDGIVYRLTLRDPGATRLLGEALAQTVARLNPGCLLLRGALGAGKTALAAALVNALPGGDQAEASSPSFTICNIYCTAPQVHHYDLYRLAPETPMDALAESLDDSLILTVVEWPERMARQDAPGDGVVIALTPGENATAREAELTALGPLGERFLAILQTMAR